MEVILRNAQILRQFGRVIKSINRLTWTRRTFVQHRRKTCVFSPCGFQSMPISSFKKNHFLSFTQNKGCIMTRLNTNSDCAHICPLNCVAKTSSPPAPHHKHVGTQPTRLSCVCVSVSPTPRAQWQYCTSPYVPLHSYCVLAMLPVFASDLCRGSVLCGAEWLPFVDCVSVSRCGQCINEVCVCVTMLTRATLPTECQSQGYAHTRKATFLQFIPAIFLLLNEIEQWRQHVALHVSFFL